MANKQRPTICLTRCSGRDRINSNLSRINPHENNLDNTPLRPNRTLPSPTMIRWKHYPISNNAFKTDVINQDELIAVKI